MNSATSTLLLPTDSLGYLVHVHEKQFPSIGVMGVASDMVCSLGSLCFEGKGTLVVTQAKSSEYDLETMSLDNDREATRRAFGSRCVRPSVTDPRYYDPSIIEPRYLAGWGRIPEREWRCDTVLRKQP